ncbi:MAG: hypothetical protein AB7H86_11075 [Blastocatellales bacterium]
MPGAVATERISGGSGADEFPGVFDWSVGMNGTIREDINEQSGAAGG